MGIFDVAVFGFALFGALAAASLLALLKPARRSRAWLGLKVGLAGIAVAMGVAMATSPPKAVLEVEATARLAKAERSPKDTAAAESAAADANWGAIRAETEKRTRAEAVKAVEAAAGQAKTQARKQALEAQIDWSNRLWALSTLSAGYIKGGDLDGLANTSDKVGELFIEASQWEKVDAKLAYLCSQAAGTLKNAIIAARDGNMYDRPDSFVAQMQRWNSQHDQCTAMARKMRGEPAHTKAKTAG